MKETKRAEWNDSHYVKVYMLSRQGLSKNAIAKAMGILRQTLDAWMKKRPALKEALNLGRGKQADGKVILKNAETFQEYIYKRLPPDLQKLWDRIEECDETENPNVIRRMQAILNSRGKYARMHLFLHALMMSNFNVSEACRKVNINTSTFQQWCVSEPDFARLFGEMDFHRKNFYEGALVELVDRGDTAAVIFANRTYNRDRGYSEKHEIEMTSKLGGNIIDLDQLELSLEVRKQILLAVRKQKEKTLNGGKLPVLEYVVKDGKGVPVNE